MKGQFELNEEMLLAFENDLGKATNYVIGKLLNNPNHNIGWFARRLNPVTNNVVYVFDTRFSEKITGRKFINYILSYKANGWELAYDVKITEDVA